LLLTTSENSLSASGSSNQSNAPDDDSQSRYISEKHTDKAMGTASGKLSREDTDVFNNLYKKWDNLNGWLEGDSRFSMNL
jgi:hypothetical protein